MPSFSFPKAKEEEGDHHIEIHVNDLDKSCTIDVSNGATHSLYLTHNDALLLTSLMSMVFGGAEGTVRIKNG